MASIKVILYTSKTLSNGEHPIVIQLIKDRKIKKISIGHSCKAEQWDFKANLPKKKHPQYRELEILIEKKKNEAKALLLTLETEKNDFSFIEYEKKYHNKNKRITVFTFLDKIVEDLIKANRVGNSDVYKDLKRKLSRHTNGKDLTFSEIDQLFLNKLEQDFRERKMSEVSMSTYFRTLRATYNKAISEGYAKRTDYPFEIFKIAKFNTKTQKRAISQDDIEKIINFSAEIGSKLYDSKSIFIFSYYAWGINFNDIAKLEWKNFHEGTLNYIRSKTKKPQSVFLLPPAIEIMEYYREYRADNYIFPILDFKVHTTPVSIKYRIKKMMKQVNKDIKYIAQQVGIKEDITTYVARHTFATVMKRNGTSITIIKDLLGHGTEQETKIYLDDFASDTLYKATEVLIRKS
ncbi:site-specific integrase [Emticicia agri]|uniref:Site-specific integrase n=1 Tax=Emticicia agri TaxID=2492393 RepID=A0A4Q5LY65_9BACT|nr:site-specific integrase [Emticicia agri]RYU94738.1 site-specific integrase [Emticicia agri]